jgi:tripartite-type tricarboxylate transporter receptor subunit TctC
MSTSKIFIAAIVGLSLTSSLAYADDTADFYKGKTVNIIAGSSAGGGLDIYARLLGHYMSKHIAGNPTIVVQNVPGAGSLSAARQLYSVYPKDGTYFGIVLPGSLLDPLFSKADLGPYNPTKFNFLGNGNAETLVCIARRDAPVKNYGDIFNTELLIGGTGPGSSLVDYPVATKAITGAKLKLIAGYKGSREVSMAIMQGEVQGICGLNWSSAKQQYPDVFKADGAVKVLVQEDNVSWPELKAMNVPLSLDFFRDKDQHKLMEVMYAQAVMGRPFVAPPETPAPRVAALRKAFMDTFRDPELIGEAKKGNIDVVANSGDEVQAWIDKLYATPKDMIDKLAAASVNTK